MARQAPFILYIAIIMLSNTSGAPRYSPTGVLLRFTREAKEKTVPSPRNGDETKKMLQDLAKELEAIPGLAERKALIKVIGGLFRPSMRRIFLCYFVRFCRNTRTRESLKGSTLTRRRNQVSGSRVAYSRSPS